jgi:hypothetical protein
MPSEEFEPAIPATILPQTYVLDLAATGIGISLCLQFKNYSFGIIEGRNVKHVIQVLFKSC